MKIKFKKQQFQTNAVKAVADCFIGQPNESGFKYRIDPGRSGEQKQFEATTELEGFRNEDFKIPKSQILKNIQEVQGRDLLPVSASLVSGVCDVNLDIEMETGTGKTYCYIKSMFEMNKRYGWTKFIVVVPSIAIREGVRKSLDITAEHFLEQYHKRARSFVYNSKELHNLEHFSSDSGINVMVINVQAFNARGKDARRIYEELDDFQSRRPIDVIKANRPILILDEPQKMEGKKTVASLKEFNPLFILRYSATHKTEHNKIHRLDALDAYNQKLVKKIGVRGISVKGLSGTNAYLYLESIEISKSKPPVARLEIEVKQKNTIKRIMKKIGKNDNLFDLSNELDQYKDGFTVSDIDAIKDTISFTNGVELTAGDATGDVTEDSMRRIKIREAIRAHFEKERRLFKRGIKVLSLFFIDEVSKYRQYDESGQQVDGEYAKIFEEEYRDQLDENLTLFGEDYDKYLQRDRVDRIHEGYFSIDKKTKQLVDPKVKRTGEMKGEADDVAAYDLILKNKERLLSLEEPVRFIFSHSALREGWDNPNVFVICTLKKSDNTISRRQEVGRGMRLCVNQDGDRIDDPAIVHDINVLTVIASESYKDFVKALQKDISSSLSSRPTIANEEYFEAKVFATDAGDVKVTPKMAKQIYRYLVKNDYTDDSDQITANYHEAKENGELANLPEELKPYEQQVFRLIDSVFSPDQMPEIGDDRKPKSNPISDNFHKKEFQDLWAKINRKAAYSVEFDSEELIKKCVSTLDSDLNVTPLQYTIQKGEQKDEASFEGLKKGEGFKIKETKTSDENTSVHSSVKYDLIGNIAEQTQLTRKTIAEILKRVNLATFGLFKVNPEDFLMKTSRFISEQKATVIVEHLTYDMINDSYSSDIFTQQKKPQDFSKAFKADRHVYDYVFTDSKMERKFVEELDTSVEVVVYAKLPRSFSIPTPVGSYNPDWAIAFKSGEVKHIFFIAETKGSLSSLQLREIEKCKVECARRFFTKITSEQVKYDVVTDYEKLMELVK